MLPSVAPPIKFALSSLPRKIMVPTPLSSCTNAVAMIGHENAANSRKADNHLAEWAGGVDSMFVVTFDIVPLLC